MGENSEIIELTCLGKSRRHCSHQILGMIICHHPQDTWLRLYVTYIQLPHPRGMQGRKFIGHISQIRESISEHQHSSVFRLHTHYGIGWPISHFSISRIVCYWASTRYLHAWNNQHSHSLYASQVLLSHYSILSILPTQGSTTIEFSFRLFPQVILRLKTPFLKLSYGHSGAK